MHALWEVGHGATRVKNDSPLLFCEQSVSDMHGLQGDRIQVLPSDPSVVCVRHTNQSPFAQLPRQGRVPYR